MEIRSRCLGLWRQRVWKHENENKFELRDEHSSRATRKRLSIAVSRLRVDTRRNVYKYGVRGTLYTKHTQCSRNNEKNHRRRSTITRERRMCQVVRRLRAVLLRPGICLVYEQRSAPKKKKKKETPTARQGL